MSDAVPPETTRDLLAEIASREPAEPRPAELERRERTFVRWLLGTIAVLVVLLLAGLWWLDPVSATGRQTRFSVVENGGVRQAKLDLMEELPAAPEILVLGSSRSMKLDPEVIEAVTGKTAFNGGVSGGTSKDVYLYARYADQLWANDGDETEFPHLVIGVMNDVLRNDGTAAFDPRLRRFLPAAQRTPAFRETVKALLQWKTLQAARRSVPTVVRRDGVDTLLDPEGKSGAVTADLATEGAQRGNKKENFSARGMQEFPPVRNEKAPIAARVEAQMTEYVARSYTADAEYTGADAVGVEMLRRTIRLANDNGDVPTLWKTPFQPSAIDFLPDSYEARNERFDEVIEELQDDEDLEFNYVDFDDIAEFGGVASDFYDGIHMTEANTERIIRRLDELGLLTRSGTTDGDTTKKKTAADTTAAAVVPAAAD